MADEIIKASDLAFYPGIALSSTETTQLIVDLVNEMIVEITGVLDPVPARVKSLAYTMAARALRNPEGYSSITKQLDDWKTTVRREGPEPEGVGVYLSDDERAWLTGLADTTTRSGSIRLKVPGYGHCQ